MGRSDRGGGGAFLRKGGWFKCSRGFGCITRSDHGHVPCEQIRRRRRFDLSEKEEGAQARGRVDGQGESPGGEYHPTTVRPA